MHRRHGRQPSRTRYAGWRAGHMFVLLAIAVSAAFTATAGVAAADQSTRTLLAGPLTPQPAIAAQALPTPTFPPVWTRSPRTIRAGSRAVFVLDPVSAVRCTITLRGPSTGQAISWSIIGRGRLAAFTLRTRRNAAPGNWSIAAACPQPIGPILVSDATATVTGGRGHRGSLVARRDIAVQRRSVFPGSGAGHVRGQGAGANPFDPRQCTYWAFAKRADVYEAAVKAGVPKQGLVAHPAFSEDWVWNGKRWAENARRAGIPTGTIPVEGALFVDTNGKYGHVAYVEHVNPDGSFQISQHNQSGCGCSTATTVSTQYPGRAGVEFVYGGPAVNPYAPKPSNYVGHIVQWNGDRNPQKTAWLVGPEGKRYWIPTIAIYFCLKEQGHLGPEELSAAMLEALPDSGKSATCSGGKGGGSEPLPHTEPPPGEAPPPPPPPPPPPATYAETVGGVTHTWTNYTNAGGSQGPSIPSNDTVQIACKVTGFRVEDGDTWWYRVASSPWNSSYYASADAFYNNGQTSGSLKGTPFVDPAVPNC
jgi:surface antigen